MNDRLSEWRNGRLPADDVGSLRDADSIQHKMAHLRNGLRVEAAKISHDAKEATHWQFYVRKFPLTCAGLALLAGYSLVPAKKQVVQPTEKQLHRLVKSGDLRVSSAPPKSREAGLASKAFLAVGAMAARAALSYAGEQIGQKAAPNSSGSKA